jgi:hypothetical protein
MKETPHARVSPPTAPAGLFNEKRFESFSNSGAALIVFLAILLIVVRSGISGASFLPVGGYLKSRSGNPLR